MGSKIACLINKWQTRIFKAFCPVHLASSRLALNGQLLMWSATSNIKKSFKEFIHNKVVKMGFSNYGNVIKQA